MPGRVSDSVGKDSVLKETTSDAKKIGQNYRGLMKCSLCGNRYQGITRNKGRFICMMF